jgi:hypothetical protein
MKYCSCGLLVNWHVSSIPSLTSFQASSRDMSGASTGPEFLQVSFSGWLISPKGSVGKGSPAIPLAIP